MTKATRPSGLSIPPLGRAESPAPTLFFAGAALDLALSSGLAPSRTGQVSAGGQPIGGLFTA